MSGEWCVGRGSVGRVFLHVTVSSQRDLTNAPSVTRPDQTGAVTPLHTQPVRLAQHPPCPPGPRHAPEPLHEPGAEPVHHRLSPRLLQSP